MGGVLAGVFGLVAVAAGPAGAVTVDNEADLRTAFADPDETEIVLANDIDLVDCDEGDLDRIIGVDPLQPLTIDGQDFTIRQRCPERVMDTEGDLSLVNVTVTGGNAPTGGGGGVRLGNVAIVETPSLTLRSSTITGNRASGGGSGGGIDGLEGEFVLVVDSTISDNFAGDAGGGIRGGPSTTVIRSTVSGNSTEGDTGFGGGIDADGGPLLVVNSTIVANEVLGDTEPAGGIFGGDVTIVYSTITGNSATLGANLTVEDPGPLNLFGTVIAQPQGGGENCLFEADPTTVSSGYNFSDDASCALTDPTDVEDGGDPLLGLLAANGGPTLTRLPQLGPPVSPLIDAIPVSACGDGDALAGEAVTTDQRGVTRPQTILDPPGCDIGAVEVEPPPVPVPVVLVPTFTG
jgi:hypothetical protein